MYIGLKRGIIIAAIVVVGFVAGRLFFREIINLLVGGTLFGGDFL